MRKRRAFVAFPTEHSTNVSALKNAKILEGLNIRFNVKCVSSFGIPEYANIDIYNPNREDLEFLTTSAETWMKKQSLIQLFVGYDDNVNCIFSGRIMEAPVEGYPDLALHIKGQSGAEYMSDVITVEKDNIKVIDLIDYTSSVTGYPVNIPTQIRNTNESLNKTLEHFSFTGTPWRLLDEIQAMSGGFDVENKGFNLGVYNDQTYVWTPEQATEGRTLLISEKTGMIGVPSLQSYGITVKTLLNPNVVVGDVVEVVSNRMPIVNGAYYINEILHEGELRGRSWYTTLRCNRVGKEMEVLNGKVKV